MVGEAGNLLLVQSRFLLSDVETRIAAVTAGEQWPILARNLAQVC